MSEHDIRKQLLLERVQANREQLHMEVEALRGKFDVASGILKFAGDMLPQVGTAAVTAAGAARVGKAGVGSALGLAALAPVVISVARLVVDRSKKRSAQKKSEGEFPKESTLARESVPETD
jgi:hypothetical protein